MNSFDRAKSGKSRRLHYNYESVLKYNGELYLYQIS